MSALHAVRAGSPRPAGTWHPESPRVVALGGGTGLPILLEGLAAWLCPDGEGAGRAPDDRLTAIVSMADDGGSSGRLREVYDLPPPGDLRNCLLALAPGDAELRELFAYRFEGGQDVGGHSLGNLILAALTRLEPGLDGAIARAGAWLGSRGRVIPCTLESIVLRALFDDGSEVRGESAIASVRRPIRRLRIEPAGARAHPAAVEALGMADLVVLGPGSLYTSLLPVLLVPGVSEAIARSHARVALVCNLLTEPGETDGFSAADFVLTLRDHVPGLRLDDILLHHGAIETAPGGAAPVLVDIEPLRFLGVRPVAGDLAGPGPAPRHDPGRLARALVELALGAPLRVRRP